MTTLLRTIYPAVATSDPFAEADTDDERSKKEEQNLSGTIERRGPVDDNGLVTQIKYTPIEGGEGNDVRLYERTVERFKYFYRGEKAAEALTKRKSLKRFGAALNAKGLERGVSMVAVDKTVIEDPLSDEANQTGEERLIARLQATVRTRGTNRSDGDDFASYVGNTSRSNSNQRYRASPGRFRPGQGQQGSGNSPGRGFNRNCDGNGGSSNGGRNSPIFGKRSGNNSNPRGQRPNSNQRGQRPNSNQRGQRSPAGSSAFNQGNRNTNNRSPAR